MTAVARAGNEEWKWAYFIEGSDGLEKRKERMSLQILLRSSERWLKRSKIWRREESNEANGTRQVSLMERRDGADFCRNVEGYKKKASTGSEILSIMRTSNVWIIALMYSDLSGRRL